MRRLFLSTLLLLGILSCGLPHDETTTTPQATSSPELVSPPESEPAQPVTREVLESYSDHFHIGRRGRNKIEIDIVNNGPFRAYHPTNLAIIRFYSLGRLKKWESKQTLELEDDALAEADPQFTDFNDDGLKDVTFVSGTAARGANEIRTLLIYNKERDSLMLVKNSREFPNLEHNRTLHCIDSWMFHGATTTVFLKLKGDELVEFASVGTGSELVVDVIDKNGESKTILRKKMKEDDVYTRFENFRPLSPRL